MLNEQVRQHLRRDKKQPAKSPIRYAIQPHEFEALRIGLSINQHQIGPQVTVPMIYPLAG